LVRRQTANLRGVPDTSLPEKITACIIELLAEERRRQGLTYEDLAARAGVDRSTVALWDRGERSPRFEVVLKVCHALGLELSTVLVNAEAAASGLSRRAMPKRPPRRLPLVHFFNAAALKDLTGLSLDMLGRGIEHCHQTLDTIDFQLRLHGAKPIGQLVELANLSSMLGNLLAEGLAASSDGLYARNTPHSYPDLLPLRAGAVPLEVKIALETNRPKGHLPKAGAYLVFRYVLCDQEGSFQRGKEQRGNTAYIWEARTGFLTQDDFDLSNTAGDSGKTAVVKTTAYHSMTLVYFNPSLMPYKKPRPGYPA
jgi:transcriptional regulator with XRE-family HTH domain